MVNLDLFSDLQDPSKYNSRNVCSLKEGPEGVKWELGFGLFFH